MSLGERGENEKSISEKTHFEKFKERVKKYIETIIAGIFWITLSWFFKQIAPYLTIETVGFTITIAALVAVSILFYGGLDSRVKDISRSIDGLMEITSEGFSRLIEILEKRNIKINKQHSSNPSQKEKKEEIETTGVGALAGMIFGGAIGLLGGFVGVLVCGIIGALIGNHIEYERERERKKREEERRKKLEAFLRVIKEEKEQDLD